MTKPITDEQVDRLIESLPPMYDKDFKQSFKNCINQTRNQAFKEVLELKLMEDIKLREIDGKMLPTTYLVADTQNILRQELRASIKELGENK